MRILWVLLPLVSLGAGIIGYILFAVAAPSEDTLNPPPPPVPAPQYR